MSGIGVFFQRVGTGDAALDGVIAFKKMPVPPERDDEVALFENVYVVKRRQWADNNQLWVDVYELEVCEQIPTMSPEEVLRLVNRSTPTTYRAGFLG